MTYAWGFSWQGLAIFALALLPNLLYFRMAKGERPSVGRNVLYKVLTLLEHGSQAVFVMLLLFLTGNGPGDPSYVWIVVMCVCLLTYYALWLRYYAGKRNAALLVGMATLPVVYFIAAELWLGIPPAMIPTILFGLAHLGVTWLDLNGARPPAS